MADNGPKPLGAMLPGHSDTEPPDICGPVGLPLLTMTFTRITAFTVAQGLPVGAEDVQKQDAAAQEIAG